MLVEIKVFLLGLKIISKNNLKHLGDDSKKKLEADLLNFNQTVVPFGTRYVLTVEDVIVVII